MKSLFLGLGKVNLSLSKTLSGSKRALVEEGADLVISEYGEKDTWREVSRFAGSFDTYDFSQELPANVYISPGVDPRRKFFKYVVDREVRELDLFCEKFKGQIICVTGTDGKSTFTLQLGEILKRAMPERRIFVGGNIGTAMFEAFDQHYDLAVLEVSSFQCERLKSAKPNFAILLNLATDHLDRYDSLNDYFSAKWNIISRAKTPFYPSDIQSPPGLKKSDAQYSNESSILEILKIVGQRLAGVFGFEMKESFFEKLPSLRHRLELWQARGSDKFFVNDSKATTVHAVHYGVNRMKKRFASIALILGGKYKGDDFRVVAGHMRTTDRILLCGEARDEIHKQIAGCRAPVSIYGTLKDCLNSAIHDLEAGQCLMLSPGCSSYDEFNNFEDRGEFFLDEVRRKFDIEKLS